jgi:hypothetical protein
VRDLEAQFLLITHNPQLRQARVPDYALSLYTHHCHDASERWMAWNCSPFLSPPSLVFSLLRTGRRVHARRIITVGTTRH